MGELTFKWVFSKKTLEDFPHLNSIALLLGASVSPSVCWVHSYPSLYYGA